MYRVRMKKAWKVVKEARRSKEGLRSQKYIRGGSEKRKMRESHIGMRKC